MDNKSCKTCLYLCRYSDSDEHFCCIDIEPRDADDWCADWEETPETCARCGGTGVIEDSLTNEFGHEMYVNRDCPDCDGITPAIPPEAVCEWAPDTEGDGCYKTQCDNLHWFGEGDIIENDYAYCPYCGRKVKENKNEA